MEEWDSRQRASPLSPRAWVVLNVLVLVIIIVPPRYGVQVIIREKKIHILRVSKGSQSVGRTGRGLLNQQRGSVSLVLGDPLALWGGLGLGFSLSPCRFVCYIVRGMVAPG